MCALSRLPIAQPYVLDPTGELVGLVRAGNELGFANAVRDGDVGRLVTTDL